MRLIEDIEISIDTDEVIRMLRSGKKSKKQTEPSADLIEQIEILKKLAKKLIKTKGIYSVFKSSNFYPKFLFNKSEKTVLALCTIGKNLERESRKRIEQGNLSEGVILDAIASVAAEETAEQLNKILLIDLKELIKDNQVTCRFSPGYCQWELAKGQELIFDKLDSRKVGVKLSSSKMMNPVKSVSFAINIGSEVDLQLGKRGCENCEMINCAYRRN